MLLLNVLFKVSLVFWWHMHVIPAMWEAEAGGSLELRGSGLQCAMPGQRVAEGTTCCDQHRRRLH